MKKNSLKLLIWAFSEQEERRVDTKDLDFLWPDLSPSGRRSLLTYLKKQSLVAVANQQIRLTSYGQSFLASNFALFNQHLTNWKGEWSLISFLASPKGDPAFRYLRKFLLDKQLGQLSRGNYLWPGDLPAEILSVLNKLYKNKILMLSFKKFVFGDQKQIITKTFNLEDVLNLYSGIGKEIDQLLEAKNKNKISKHQSKVKIFMVFDRLLEMLKNDLGLLKFYFQDQAGLLNFFHLLNLLQTI